MATTTTMRAQVLEAFGEPYTLKDLPMHSSPKGPDLLVRVLAASYCHTDAVFASGAMQQVLPRVGSHEMAGEIVEIGPDVPSNMGFSKGMKIGIPGRAYHPCGECYECKNNEDDAKGYGVWCPKATNLGLTRDGGFQEYLLCDSRQVAPIPEPLTAVETAPLMCAGVTIWAGLGRAGVDLTKEKGGKGLKIAISGAGGGLGHLGVQFAAKMGCEVVAVDAADRPLELIQEVIQELGEDGKKVTVVDARKEDIDTVLEKVSGKVEDALKGERGCDSCLILPESQRALDYGTQLLKNHGTCVVVSFPKEGFHISARDLVFRDIKMIGTLVGRNRQLRAMLEFAAQHNVRAQTQTYPLDKLNTLVGSPAPHTPSAG